jgi:peptidoglycan hydrolase-like protein with peptidoglycan-binding domain
LHCVLLAAAFIAVLAVGIPATALAARAFGSRVLQQGMSGGDVSTLQRWLTIAGFKTPVLGVFGPITAVNVRRFERTYHLHANGVVTVPVARELQAVVADKTNGTAAGTGGGASMSTVPVVPPPPAPPPPNPAAAAPTSAIPASTGLFGARVLRPGNRGPSVREMQQYLTSAGFAVTIDGDFGPATQQQVMAFEASKSLPADGIVSLPVANALRAAVAAVAVNNTGATAVLAPDGLAIAPANAPLAVKEVIAAANEIATLPYIYGGGHASWNDTGYDCSGSTSFALHGAGMISAPEDSGELETYGQPGPGNWITLYANGGHVYMNIAGLWFDTAAQSASNNNDRWSTTRISPSSGFVVRHPLGF